MQTIQKANLILETLEKNKYQAYLVGGCVRDLLLSKKPLDYDITTNARPDDVETLFEKTVPTGKEFGTVTVILDHIGYETTTYRLETEYTDGRRPKAIQFADDLLEDLSRRDFTINALVMDAQGDVFDYFKGKDDLEDKIIRTIGDPHLRFSEDYLRMLRAIRFSCVLDFEIESKTYEAIKEHSHKIKYISFERIRDELNKILISNQPSKGFKLLHDSGMLNYILPEVEACYGFEINNPAHHLNVFDHTLKVMDNTRPMLELRLAALLHDISKPNVCVTDEHRIDHFEGHQKASAEMSRHILYRLKYSKKMIYHVVKLVENHQHRELDLKPAKVKLLIRALDIRHFPSLIELMEADIKANKKPHDFTVVSTLRAIYQEVLDHNHPVQISDLAINGNDVARFGYRRKEIGDVLMELFHYVLEHPHANTRDMLFKRIQSK